MLDSKNLIQKYPTVFMSVMAEEISCLLIMLKSIHDIHLLDVFQYDHVTYHVLVYRISLCE